MCGAGAGHSDIFVGKYHQSLGCKSLFVLIGLLRCVRFVPGVGAGHSGAGVELYDMGWLRLVGSINDRSVLQNSVSFIGLFCKRDLSFYRSY